ncbi:MAG: glycosyltransferase family 4 protein [bacterium]|nr:MAG: glycosyltransferase family 4 protein [bacterium]
MKIAFVGSKGLPAVFGGIERHVEEIGRRLVHRGHAVTVFGRKPFSTGGEYQGMQVRLMPSIPTKNLETATNSLAATVCALFEPFDIIHYHGIGPSLFCWIPVFSRKTTVATIHAPDYRQVKWGRIARTLLRLGERTAARHADAVVAVSRLMSRELGGLYGREITYIPNGATLYDQPPFERARELGLESGNYILTVGRFIFERGFHTLLEAFREVDTDQRLAIVGDARFEEEYAAGLTKLADERVIFPGHISGPLLNELYAHCSFYVLPSLLEGLPISLIEAMSFARPVIVSDIPENLEVAEGIAMSFRRGDPGDLAGAIRRMLSMNGEELADLGERGRTRVEEEYTWERVTDSLESLYRAALGS